MANTSRLGPMRRGINVLMTTMIRIGVGAPSNYLLTTTGRKTGSPRTTPVTLVESDGGRWLVGPVWSGGLGPPRRVSPPEVSLRRGRRTEVHSAMEVDAETAGPVLQRYVREVRVTAPFFNAKAGDPVGLFVEEAPASSRFSSNRRWVTGEDDCLLGGPHPSRPPYIGHPPGLPADRSIGVGARER